MQLYYTTSRYKHQNFNSLQLLGVKNEIIGLVLCLSFGFIFGIIYGSVEHWSPEFWLTDEMIAR